MPKTKDHQRPAAPDMDGLDRQTPGQVYLCQINDSVSCGACCGLYNVSDISRDKLTRMLADRTRRFARVPRTIEAIDDFAGEIFFRDEGQKRPIRDFHHCPFLGLIGPKNRTVGCLLHPLAAGNAGIDWRGLSYYGAFACATYFCPTCHNLARRYKRLIRKTADNWYDYGLMITETDMLETFLRQVEDRLGRQLDEQDMILHPGAAAGMRDFLSIKTTWPFRDPDRSRPANYFFNRQDDQPPAIDILRPDGKASAWIPVLTALWSKLPSSQALAEAESFLDRMADDIARAMA